MLAAVLRKVNTVFKLPTVVTARQGLRQGSKPLCKNSLQRSKLVSFATMSSTLGTDYLVWVDLEMTGLNIKKDKIIEMAVLITDKDLNLVAEVRHNLKLARSDLQYSLLGD